MLDHAALIRELWAEMLADEEKANIPTRLVKLLSVHAWIERDIPAPDQILGDVLTAGGRMFLIGRTGLGKTQLALGCGTGFATGEGFLHWRCTKPKRVLIIDGEMPEGLIKARAIDAMRRINDKPQPENLIIYSRYLEDEFVELFPEIGKMPPLNTEEGRIWVLALVDALGGADVVIFDNVMSLTIGDQKDEVSWSGVMPLVQELTARNIAQLWLDHTGHNTERQYGSSTKAWPFDSSGIMAPLKEDQCCDREVAFTLSFEFPGKARRRTPDNWHDFETCIIRLKDDRWLSEPVNKATSRLGSVPKSREVFYDALAAAIGKSAVGAGRATLAAWELECQRRSLIEPAPETEDHKQRSGRLALFRASKSALLSARWIAIQDDLGSEGQVGMTLFASRPRTNSTRIYRCAVRVFAPEVFVPVRGCSGPVRACSRQPVRALFALCARTGQERPVLVGKSATLSDLDRREMAKKLLQPKVAIVFYHRLNSTRGRRSEFKTAYPPRPFAAFPLQTMTFKPISPNLPTFTQV